MKKNCDIIKDLIPMYVENLTSENSTQFIEEHLHSCEDCTNYLRNIERDLPNDTDSLDEDVDKNDQKLLKGIQRRMYNMLFIAILIGVLIGSLVFFNMAIVVGVLCIFTLIYFIRAGKEVNVEKRGFTIVIFVLSLFSFFISLKLFWNVGVYADDYGSSPVLVYRGWFWLCLAWLRLALLAVITFISGMKLYSN
ncbi:hypothetical protein GMD78_19985 [Ornithinibacillus sp. L9]|uniref:Putative zinc-finger domain-containing protein n=1 Tax=Ornithinibacillus caprae TaxID=2678566 RepID=A0A6N8FLX5_9BACI|nr:zf-HC2 domain-containing protein [Ornithinibacillus caprae]MUK90640.1 hypothetical protein [Ornithinibacillus caprae]